VQGDNNNNRNRTGRLSSFTADSSEKGRGRWMCSVEGRGHKEHILIEGYTATPDRPDVAPILDGMGVRPTTRNVETPAPKKLFPLGLSAERLSCPKLI